MIEQQRQSTSTPDYSLVACDYRWGQDCDDFTSGMHRCTQTVSILTKEVQDYNSRTAKCPVHICRCSTKVKLPQELDSIRSASGSL